jgi:type I restriction enzyme S subunit
VNGQQSVSLKYVVRLAYGDALPKDQDQEGSIKVFGSSGPYATTSQANTSAPAIIVGRKDSYGKVNWSEKACFASATTFFIDATTTQQNLRWLFYVLQTLHLDKGSDEAAVPGLNRDDVYQKKILVPSLSEQQAIADYLDHETARIDTLIAAMEELLALLAEKRQALISHAVTHGLNPDVPMQDTGVEWLGAVPAHWECEIAHWLFGEVDERSSSTDEELLTVSHHTGVTPRSEKNVSMFMAESTEGYKMCQPGDLIINTLWAWMGALGVAFQHGVVSPNYHVYRPQGKLDAHYLDYLVRVPAFATEITRYSKGVWSSRLRLYPEEFFQIPLPVPPLAEQKEIAYYLAHETKKLDALNQRVQETIALLRERRTALITAAVTGHLNVYDEKVLQCTLPSLPLPSSVVLPR